MAFDQNIEQYIQSFIFSITVQSPHLNKIQNAQGSKLGPLLYFIYMYVNDIGNSCPGNILSFADDTTLYISDSDIKTLFDNSNKQINQLFEWLCSNKLSLNVKKTKYTCIVLRPKHMRGDKYTDKPYNFRSNREWLWKKSTNF